MKRYEIKKEARDFGNRCDWYNRANLGAVEAANPTRPVGGRLFPAAFFVFANEWVTDEMREFNPSHCWSVQLRGNRPRMGGNVHLA